MTDLDFLATVEVCSGLDQAELAQILERTDLVRRAKGERILAEGDEAEDLFFVVQGRVDLRFEIPGRNADKEMTVSTVRPGGTFGWSALVPPHRYTLSSYAADEDCVLLHIKSRDLNQLFEMESRIGYIFMRNLAWVIGKRFHDLEEELVRREGMDLIHKW